MNMKRGSELAMIVCFLLFLAAGAAGIALREPQSVSFYENRMLATFPERSAQAMGDGSFVTQLERYLSDHAPLRTTCLKLKAGMDLALCRPVVNDIAVTPGPLLPFLAPQTVDEEQLAAQAESMADNLKRISDTVAEYGGYYCHVAVPPQYNYYEDEYPWFLDNWSGYSDLTLELLSRELERRGVALLDLGPVFDGAGHPADFYSKVDHHYTMKGAFVAYRAIMEKAAAESGLAFPILAPEDVSFETLPNDYFGSRERSVINMATREEHTAILHTRQEVPFTRTDNGVEVPAQVYVYDPQSGGPVTYGIYMGGDIPNTVVDTHREDLPTILIYGDSLTNALECITYHSFDEMHSLDLRYYEDMSLEDYIRQVRPDVVICVRDYKMLLEQADNGGGI